MTVLLDGADLAEAMLPASRAAASRCLLSRGRPPTLALVTASADPAQEGWVALKLTAAQGAGIAVRRIAVSGRDAALRAVVGAGADHDVDGIFCQLPFDGLGEAALAEVLAAIPTRKDVDGASPASRAALTAGLTGDDRHRTPGDTWRPATWRPATALAAVDLLRHHDVPLTGRALVAGTHPDGDAIALLLQREGVRVDRIHSLSSDAAGTRPAYGIVVAGGPLPRDVPDGLLAEDVAMIDLGYAPVRPHLPEAWVEEATWHCPARGGLGPATIAVLLRHTAEAAQAAARGADGMTPD